MSNIMYLTVAALCYTVLTAIVFFNKNKLETTENRIYKVILCISLCSLVMELLIPLYASFNFFALEYVTAKLYLLCCVSWVSALLYYTFVISYQKILESNRTPKKYQLIINTFMIITIVLSILILVLPMYFKTKNGVSFTEGVSINLTFGTCGTYMFLMIVILLRNIKNIKRKGYIPVIAFVILLSLSTIIQKINPSFLIINFIFGFITCLMYHTIENPDLKMIQELLTNRELVQNSLEERSRFLFKMSQDLRKPINNLQSLLELYSQKNNKEEKEEIMNIISSNIKNVSYIVNDVFDISEMESKEIRAYNTSYDTDSFFKDIEKKTENLIKDKKIKLFFDISKEIPKKLFGDSIKLKQMLMGVINNSVKYTKEGFIDIQVDVLVRYDVCRLMIEIIDSGKGIGVEKINNIIGQIGELSKEELKSLDGLNVNLKTINKTLKLLGGSLNIKSEENKGTTVVICMDQKIDSKYIRKKYSAEEFGLLNKSKVLIISDDLEEITSFEEKFSKYNTLVNSSMFGNDAVKKIENGNKYDLIIIKDRMQEENGYSIMKKLKDALKYKNPIIISINKKQEKIKDHYINDGFTDCIIDSDLENEIDKLYNKYM